jgi:hypothetical protein
MLPRRGAIEARGHAIEERRGAVASRRGAMEARVNALELRQGAAIPPADAMEVRWLAMLSLVRTRPSAAARVTATGGTASSLSQKSQGRRHGIPPNLQPEQSIVPAVLIYNSSRCNFANPEGCQTVAGG